MALRPLVIGLLFILGCNDRTSLNPNPVTDPPIPWGDGPIVLAVDAKGDQIYTWKTDATTGKSAWALKAPDATFSGGGVTGTHYAGPTWQAADGSKIVARKVAELPSPDPNAVPWLLLQVTLREGNGLPPTTYIKRVHTTGGKAPTTPGNSPNQDKRVPYTAQYLFYGPGTTTQPAK
jgi:hypothetical protein